MVAATPPPRATGTTGNSRHWKCPACGATVGILAYARGQPPELIPRMPVIAIRGGVIWFRCMGCEAPVEWRIVSAVQSG